MTDKDYITSDDPMKSFDEEDSKIIKKYIEQYGKPIKRKYLDKAIYKNGNIYIDFEIDNIKKTLYCHNCNMKYETNIKILYSRYKRNPTDCETWTPTYCPFCGVNNGGNIVE